jgi:RsiW-degrading membrane proteinase PrsW (M82 family)
MNKHCTSCGAELLPGASFCAQCGETVSTASRNAQSLPVGPARKNNRYIRWALWAAAIIAMCVLGLTGIALLGGGLGVFLLAGATIAVLPVPLYLALALWIDRYEKEPIGMLAITFLWGATVAVFFSGIINTIGGTVVGVVLGEGAGGFFTAVISAPIVEESTKGLALLVLFLWKKDEFDDVLDGIIYAVMVGLGFAMVENFLYYGRAFAEGGVPQGALVFGIRGVFSPFTHPLFTSMTGIGLGLARQTNRTFVKFAAPVVGLMGAMTLHAIWNGSSYVLGGLSLFFNLFVYTPVLIIAVLAVAAFALRREGRIVKQYLTPELHNGLISQQEYDALGSVTGRLGTSFRSLRGGFGSWRANARFSQAELAFHHDRVARGIVSVDAAQREASYVQVLSATKGN